MINGNEYSWEDIKIIIPGKPTPIDGAVSIDYETSKDHVNIHGRGDDPVAMGRGKKDYNGKLTLLQSEVEGMQSTLPPGADLTNLPPFLVTVAYAPIAGPQVVDQLAFCRITKVPKGMKTGDPNMEIELPLVIGKILYNI